MLAQDSFTSALRPSQRFPIPSASSLPDTTSLSIPTLHSTRQSQPPSFGDLTLNYSTQRTRQSTSHNRYSRSTAALEGIIASSLISIIGPHSAGYTYRQNQDGDATAPRAVYNFDPNSDSLLVYSDGSTCSRRRSIALQYSASRPTRSWEALSSVRTCRRFCSKEIRHVKGWFRSVECCGGVDSYQLAAR